MSEAKIEELELKISKFLRSGVMLSAIFLAIGLLASFFQPSRPLETYSEYTVIPFSLRVQEAWEMKNLAKLSSILGLCILVTLPMIRVFLTGFLFFKNKEKAMGMMAFIVFIILILSFTLGIDL